MYINEFYERISIEAKKITNDYEIIFVDDGSPDDGLQKAINIYQQDNKVKVIELSRNFGHHKAIMTGLKHTQGDFVFLIDSDLEEQPELLGDFWQELQNGEDLDVVYGVQEKRKGGWFEKISGDLFYKFFNKLAGINIPKNTLITKLMTKNFNKNLISFKEESVFLGGLTELTGFNQKSFICHKAHKGTTTYTLTIKLKQFINSITSFSGKPLYYIFYAGLGITSISLVYVIYLLINKFIFMTVVDGWTSMLVSIYFFGGSILFGLGVIGVYISKIFDEVKERPYTIIKKIWR